MLVGEQPGNDEDLAGHPFVGPAGRLLNDALAEAGIARAEAYVTNAVKHFKWEEAGTRRLHKKPDSHEVSACMPWLGAELESVRPKVVVALGATAAQALLGRAFRVSRQHGVPVSVPFANHAIATLHPSAVLRQRSATARAKERASLVADLRVARALLETSGD
jgi:DNA polymerase